MFFIIESRSKGEKNMWTPVIIAIIVSFLTIILLTILEKKKIIEQKSRLYKLIEVAGLYIPILVICGYYGYMKTDRLDETIIVLGGIYLCVALLALLGLFNIKERTNKYNYIYFPIVIIACYFISNYITPYMLSSIDKRFITALVGPIAGCLVASNKKKWKLIVSSTIVGLIIITDPISFISNLENSSKVENVAIEYMENLGYSISDFKEIRILSNSIRTEPIHLFTINKSSNNNRELTIYLRMVYFNGEIIEFKDS